MIAKLAISAYFVILVLLGIVASINWESDWLLQSFTIWAVMGLLCIVLAMLWLR